MNGNIEYDDDDDKNKNLDWITKKKSSCSSILLLWLCDNEF